MKISVLLLSSTFALGLMAEAPNLVKMGALLDCGIPCTTNADCAGCTKWCQTTENGGICHPHLKERSAEVKPASLMKKEVDICYSSCGADADCPSSCPYCWPTRVGGRCRLSSPPAEEPAMFKKKAVEPIAKEENIPALFKKEALAACGQSCETSACAAPCHCIGSTCGQRPKEAREERETLLEK